MKKLKVKVNCKQERCPAFQTCEQLPTIITTHTDKVEKIRIMFVCMSQDEDLPLQKVISAVTGKLGKVFNYAVTYMTRDNIGLRFYLDHESKYCRRYLGRDIKALKPNVVVALGIAPNNCINQFCAGPETAFPAENFHGSIWPSKFDSIPMMYTYNPMSGKLKTIAKDLLKLYGYLKQFKCNLDPKLIAQLENKK